MSSFRVIWAGIKNPAYREVCNGTTGHAEVIEVAYSPSVISFNTLLEVFWTTHDPTTLNTQEADRGTQYRSAIFYTTDSQKDIAIDSKANVATTLWNDPIVTEIVAANVLFFIKQKIIIKIILRLIQSNRIVPSSFRPKSIS